MCEWEFSRHNNFPFLKCPKIPPRRQRRKHREISEATCRVVRFRKSARLAGSPSPRNTTPGHFGRCADPNRPPSHWAPFRPANLKSRDVTSTLDCPLAAKDVSRFDNLVWNGGSVRLWSGLLSKLSINKHPHSSLPFPSSVSRSLDNRKPELCRELFTTALVNVEGSP